MKTFDRLILVVCVGLFGIMVFLNIIIPLIFRESDRLYVTEINRFMALEGSPDEKYRSITSADQFIYESEILSSVRFLAIDEETDLLQEMFTRNGRQYVIRPTFDDDEELQGFLQFELADMQSNLASKLRLIVNLFFLLSFVLIIFVLLYIKYKIIVPFNEISYLPIQLSKGNVKKGIPESKNRYFGKFIWGLNMMRETLSAHKRRELELLKEKKTLILSISHDINTPLAAIKLSTKALSVVLYKNLEKQQELLDQIISKTVEIENFVGDIIKISKEDLLAFEIKEQEFYLADVIDKIRSDYSELLSLQKTELIIDDFSNRLLAGDFERLIEVLQNLMENAIKYGNGKSIQISFDLEEDCQLVTVANTGNSLPMAEFVYIFESFWRGSNIGGASGSGLGLYICRTLMRQMKGDIYANIEGDEFLCTIVIPILK